MLRSTASKVMWVGRATVFLVGLAVIVALVFGAATTALGATGANFILGKANSAGAVSKLTANMAGPALDLVNQSTASAATALDLQVASGHPPLTVNSSAKVANLNADQLDGKDSAEFLSANGKAHDAAHADNADHATNAEAAPLSGYEHVLQESAFDSSAHKVVVARCPTGKRVIGGGGDAFVTLGDPNRDQAPIVIRDSEPDFSTEFGGNDGWAIIADETSAYAGNWGVRAFAICAKVAPAG
jgi:hypothetical protein